MAERIELEIILENGQLIAATKKSAAALEDTGEAAQEAGDKGSKGMKKMAGGVGMLGKALKAFLALGIVRFFIDIGKKAFKAAAQMEQFEVAFSTMLGSAKNAKNLLKEIKDFSAETPFQLPGLVETSKQLLAFGVEQEKIVETMRNLGNAAQGNQEILSRLGLAYGKVKTIGKASMEEIRQFAEAGVPIIQALADKFGVTTTAIVKMVSQGKVGFADVDMALKNLTTGTGKFAGMLEKQSRTMSGMFSTLKDNFTLVLIDMGKKMGPGIKDLIKSFGLLTKSGGVLGKVLGKVGNIVSIIGSAIAGLVTGISWLINKITVAGNSLVILNNKRKLLTATGEKQLQLEKTIKEAEDENVKSKKELIESEKQLLQIKNNLVKSGRELVGLENAQRVAIMEQAKLLADATKTLDPTAGRKGEKEDKGKKGVDPFQERLDKFANYSSSLISMASSLSGQLGDIWDAEQQRAMANLENGYKFRKALIEATVKDEDEKRKALTEQDKLFELHQKLIKRREAKREKKLRIASAIISALAAGVSALAAMSSIPIVGPILGLIFMGLTIAAGMAVVQQISQTPEPSMFAKGVFDLPENKLGMLHAGETVLTKPITENLKKSEITLSGPEGGDESPRIVQVLLDSKVLAEGIEEPRTEKARSMGVNNYGEEGVY